MKIDVEKAVEFILYEKYKAEHKSLSDLKLKPEFEILTFSRWIEDKKLLTEFEENVMSENISIGMNSVNSHYIIEPHNLHGTTEKANYDNLKREEFRSRRYEFKPDKHQISYVPEDANEDKTLTGIQFELTSESTGDKINITISTEEAIIIQQKIIEFINFQSNKQQITARLPFVLNQDKMELLMNGKAQFKNTKTPKCLQIIDFFWSPNTNGSHTYYMLDNESSVSSYSPFVNKQIITIKDLIIPIK